MKKNKTWGRVTDVVGVALIITTALAGWYIAIIGVLALWALVRSVLGRSDGGGIIGVDQQSQAHGQPHDEGNGGVGRPTFSSAWHRRP